MFSSNANAFRPRFESLEARDQPSHVLYSDLLVSSYQTGGSGAESVRVAIDAYRYSWGNSQMGGNQGVDVLNQAFVSTS